MIHVGDCRATMAAMPADSVQCIVTSPPYFGLRDYGVDGQIGLEDDPDCGGWLTGERCGTCFVCALVEVFSHARRVLRPDGTLWMNLGDTYSGGGRGGNSGAITGHGKDASTRTQAYAGDTQRVHCPRNGKRTRPGWKDKDLMGMPWRIALALQADGWFLRQDIVWNKPNPMPESIRDRFTKSHEYVFLLAKSRSYYFDQESLREPASPNTHARLAQNVAAQAGSMRANGGDARPMRAGGRGNHPSGWNAGSGRGHRDLIGRYPVEEAPPATKGVSQRTAGARAAAGQSNGVGWGYDKGEPRARKTDPGAGNKNNASFDAAMAVMPETRNKRSVWTIPTQGFKEAHFATFPEALVEPCIIAGSRAGDLVLDPFMGAGTTAVVAQRLGRQWVGCELNPEYAAIAERRIAGVTAGLGF